MSRCLNSIIAVSAVSDRFSVIPVFSDNTSDLTKYLSSTYDQWKKGSTPVYLATVRSITLTRSQATHLSIEIGDESKFLDYTNGALTANREYK